MLFNIDALVPWTADWLWSLPVSVHVFGLNLIRSQFDAVIVRATRRTLYLLSGLLMAGTTLSVTLLHGFEASVWAFAFRLLHALPDNQGDRSDSFAVQDGPSGIADH